MKHLDDHATIDHSETAAFMDMGVILDWNF